MSLAFPYAAENGGLKVSLDPNVDLVALLLSTTRGQYYPDPDLGILPYLFSSNRIIPVLQSVEETLRDYGAEFLGVLGELGDEGALDIEIATKSEVLTWTL